MVGDLVMTPNGIARVIMIGEHSPCYTTKTGEGEAAIFPSNLQPIPLTPEILEKNGFERLGTDYILMGYPFGLTNPSTPDDYKDNYWLRVAASSVNIKYVHELQHALRLCRIEKEIIL